MNGQRSFGWQANARIEPSILRLVAPLARRSRGSSRVALVPLTRRASRDPFARSILLQGVPCARSPTSWPSHARAQGDEKLVQLRIRLAKITCDQIVLFRKAACGPKPAIPAGLVFLQAWYGGREKKRVTALRLGITLPICQPSLRARCIC